MGATVSEFTLIDVLFAPGARIAKGQKIAEMESDKSAFDFDAPCDGTCNQGLRPRGDILTSGAPFLQIDTARQSLRHLESKMARGPRLGGCRHRRARRAADGSRRRSTVPAGWAAVDTPP